MKNLKRAALPLFLLWILKVACGVFWLWTVCRVKSQRKEENAFMFYFLISFSLYVTVSFQVFFMVTMALQAASRDA